MQVGAKFGAHQFLHSDSKVKCDRGRKENVVCGWGPNRKWRPAISDIGLGCRKLYLFLSVSVLDWFCPSRVLSRSRACCNHFMKPFWGSARQQQNSGRREQRANGAAKPRRTAARHNPQEPLYKFSLSPPGYYTASETIFLKAKVTNNVVSFQTLSL